MADIDIANPGANEAMLKAALGDLVGWVRVDGAAITSAAGYFDIALPSGYVRFVVALAGFRCSPGSQALTAALSSNAGTSFFCDATNFDTYGQLRRAELLLSGTATSAEAGYESNDATITIGSNTGSALLISASVTIEPGSSSNPPFVEVEARCLDPAAGAYIFERTLNFLNPSATTAPTYARMNLIRFAPAGDGTIAPPASGNTITAGSWVLLGIPTPSGA